jgi:hypothetical protein
MKIKLITEREIPAADLDEWLAMYVNDCGYPIDPTIFKQTKAAQWTSTSPEVNSIATTTMILGD